MILTDYFIVISFCVDEQHGEMKLGLGHLGPSSY